MPLLFSYGTLQQEDVQLSIFGRRLNGQSDELLAFEPSLVKIEDPQVVATLGRTHHANVSFNGNEHSAVLGTVFEITDAELASADEFEAPTTTPRTAGRGDCAREGCPGPTRRVSAESYDELSEESQKAGGRLQRAAEGHESPPSPRWKSRGQIVHKRIFLFR